MGTDGNNEIDDQLNALFDDLFEEDEAPKRAAEEVASKAEEVKEAASEKAEEAYAAHDNAAETKAEEVAEAAETVPDAEAAEAAAKAALAAVESTKAVVDDDQLENQARDLNYSDLDPDLFAGEDEAAVYVAPEKPELEIEEEDIIPADKELTGKLPAYEEDADEDEEDEADALEAGTRPVNKRSAAPTSEQLKKEYRHFWIFTAIVAVVVAVAVLLILKYRGIIGGDKETTTAATTTTLAPTTESTTEATTESTTEETTTEETTTEETTTEETTTEETTTEEPTTEDSRREVLNTYDNKVFVVTSNELNIRKEASTDSEVIGLLKKDSGGQVIEDAGEWVRIQSGGLEGYVAAEYIKTGEEADALAVELAAQRVKIDADTVNVRSSATTEGDNILGRAYKGTVLEYVDSDSEGFYHVKFEDQDAFVSSDFTKLGYYLTEAVPQ